MKTLMRILHAEDEPDIQAIARLALERVGGFTVLSCETAVWHWTRWKNFARICCCST